MKNLVKILALVLALGMITVFAASCGGTKTVETYFNSEEGKAEIEKVQEMFEGTLDVKVYAEGNEMYYDYAYTTTYDDATVEVLKETLAESLDTQASTFTSVVDAMEKEVDGEVTLTVIYRNGDDKVLAEKTFEN